MKKTEENGTRVSIVGVKANKHQAKQAVREFYDTDVAKTNSLLRSDGEKKAYVHLPSKCDHFKVANYIGLL